VACLLFADGPATKPKSYIPGFVFWPRVSRPLSHQKGRGIVFPLRCLDTFGLVWGYIGDKIPIGKMRQSG
jgi:hypothetical protein